MADPRIETVANVLRENGHNATGTGFTTDDLAAAIVGALTEQAASADEGETSAADSADAEAAAADAPANPETPTGTGTEGGAESAAT
jgi:hypothetical protein